MKLKKIASLVLAGIMAVSMLTACGKSANNGNNGEGDGENGGTATGYSSMLAEAVSDKVKKMDYVTFQDDAKVGEALEDALGNLGDVTTIGTSLLTNGTRFSKGNDMSDDFIDALDLNDFGTGWDFTPGYMMNDTRKVGDIFCFNGNIDLTKAMKTVAEKLKTQLEGLEENGSQDKLSYDYHYTVSVSVVNKSSNAIDWLHTSANFIAVTVTRTGTAA